MKTACIAARQVKAGMTVIVDGSAGEWTVLAHHPLDATWWLHRYVGEEYQTTHARYNMLQVIK